MLKSCWPNFPFSLAHLGDLSDEPEIFLCVSERSLYVLQNAVIDRLVAQGAYAESIVGEYYIPTRPDLDDYDLYLSVAEDLARDLVEVAPMSFYTQMWQGHAIDSTIYLATYTQAGPYIFADILLAATESGDGGYPIELRSFPNELAAKYAFLIGHGQFFDAGVGYKMVSAFNVSPAGSNWRFICDGATNFLGYDPATVLAPGDAFYLSLRYEI